MAGSGADGVRGLNILSEAGAKVFVQRPADYAPRDRYDRVRALGLDLADLRQEAIPDWILEQTNAARKLSPPAIGAPRTSRSPLRR